MYLGLAAFAGIIGGIAIAGVGMIYSAATGGGLWTLPNSIGGIVLGPKAGGTRSFGKATFVGVGFHMALSAIYGIATAYIVHRFNTGYVVTGIAVGVFFWLFNHFLIGRVQSGARQHARFNPIWVAFALHALYGAVTGVVAAALIG
jgi:hypothetical protein